MENRIKAKLIESIKSIILSGEYEGLSGKETMDAVYVFCDMMEDMGIPPHVIADAFNETMMWVRVKVDQLQREHTLSMN
jgi:hypothetical protein